MKINYINQFQKDILVGFEEMGYSKPVLKDVSIAESAEIYTNNNLYDKNLPNWENRQNDFKEGWQQREQQLLPIIKELGEALVYAKSFIPKKVYGQGESYNNEDYTQIQITLEKYKNYL